MFVDRKVEIWKRERKEKREGREGETRGGRNGRVKEGRRNLVAVSRVRLCVFSGEGGSVSESRTFQFSSHWQFHVDLLGSRVRVLRLPAWGGCSGGLSFRSLVGELRIPISVAAESNTCFVNPWCHCLYINTHLTSLCKPSQILFLMLLYNAGVPPDGEGKLSVLSPC
jgi:hypothetical protein